MSAAYYVLLEDGVQPEMDGKALSRFSKRLPQLLDFVQMPASELAELMEEEAPDTEQELAWFFPEVGLALVESYLSRVQGSDDDACGHRLASKHMDSLRRWGNKRRTVYILIPKASMVTKIACNVSSRPW